MSDESVPVSTHVRLEALNIASRETVARAYDNMRTVEIARDMVAFAEGTDPQVSVKELVEMLRYRAKDRYRLHGHDDAKGECYDGLATYFSDAHHIAEDVDEKAPIGSIDRGNQDIALLPEWPCAIVKPHPPHEWRIGGTRDSLWCTGDGRTAPV